METKDLTLLLAGAVGVSGAEGGAAQVAAQVLVKFGEVEISPLGSVICRIKPAQGGRHYLLDAHIDEIGMIVTCVTDDGFLKVSNVGGLDRRLLLASEVKVHAPEAVSGVICSTPPHLQSDGEKKNPKVDDIFIDIGMSKEQASAAVPLGTRVTICSRTAELLGGAITSKALDDRAGCAAIIRAAQLLADQPLHCGLTVALTTQEETGAAGARTAAFAVQPTHCITVDVSFGFTPDAKRHKCGDLGKGPMIGIAPILSRRMSERMVDIAEKAEIPYQLEVMGGATGTNADAIVVSRGGVETALLSVPMHYMHTPVEKVCVGDIEDTARLIAAYLIAEEGGLDA